MPRYLVGGDSRLRVRARSSIHDTVTVWNKLRGEIQADANTLATVGAKAVFAVDMTSFDAGDWLKNRKIRGDLALDKYPEATFELSALREVTRDGPGFSALADGTLRWRDRELVITARGSGVLDGRAVRARASFDLDIRDFGLQAPRILMFKMEDQVTVEVAIEAIAI